MLPNQPPSPVAPLRFQFETRQEQLRSEIAEVDSGLRLQREVPAKLVRDDLERIGQRVERLQAELR